MKPQNDGEHLNRKWLEATIKTKSTTTLTLAHGLAQFSVIVSDRPKTAMQLWNQLDSIFWMSHTQMIINAERELQCFTLEKWIHWEGHLKNSSLLISKLAAYDKLISSDVNNSRVNQTLPHLLAPITTVAESRSVPFKNRLLPWRRTSLKDGRNLEETLRNTMSQWSHDADSNHLNYIFRRPTQRPTKFVEILAITPISAGLDRTP